MFEPAAVLVELRGYLGLTQAGLASLLGVPRGRLARWEQGRRAIPPELARAVGLVAYVLQEKDKRYSYALGCEVRATLRNWKGNNDDG